jgi:hypothetical protein
MLSCTREIQTEWGLHEECLAVLCKETNTLVLATKSFDNILITQPYGAKPKIYSYNDLTNGIWLSYGDSFLYGGVSPTVFGIPLSKSLQDFLQTLLSPFIVLYHGTDEINFENICQQKLLPTQGQLGQGVYVGSFWKACRFACRTQDYQIRENPLVFRLYARNIYSQKYPPKFPCSKLDCIDHSKIWESGNCGRLLVGQYADGKWITKNEEWVYHPDDIFLADASRIDISSVDKPNYNPFQRNILIL